jgi:hypothetical protein
MAIHQYGEIDLVDSLLSPVFVLATAVAFGVGTFTILGYDFASTVFADGGVEVTWAFVFGASALIIAYATNQVNYDDWDELELAVVIFAAGSHLLIALVPLVRDMVVGSDIIGLIALILNGAAYYLVAYY